MPFTSEVLAAFDHGQVPTVACINRASVPLGVDFDAMVGALQKFLDQCFAPVWGTPARVVAARSYPSGAWAMDFWDDADTPGALGYHDLTPEGLPLSKVFVKTTRRVGQKVSVTASHELAEMLVDPAINLWSDGPRGSLYAYETADAVEEEEFLIDGVAMSDFVFPAYFEAFRKKGSAQFDYLKKVTRPFEILKGGYSLVRQGGRVSQIFGSAAKRKRFLEEDRRGHRSEARKARLRRDVSTGRARRK